MFQLLHLLAWALEEDDSDTFQACQKNSMHNRAMKGYSAGGSGRKKTRMRGFMCQSGSTMASVVCRSSSSVIVPRKITSSSSRCSQSDDSLSTSCSSAKYTRLVESPSLNIFYSNQRTSSSRCMGAQPRSMGSILSAPESDKDDVFQVVVMKVSIHCQGCAGKVKKHLSKMEGVTSFSIDVEAKRVIVMGYVSPDWVLESLSKVKKAELWTL